MTHDSTSCQEPNEDPRPAPPVRGFKLTPWQRFRVTLTQCVRFFQWESPWSAQIHLVVKPGGDLVLVARKASWLARLTREPVRFTFNTVDAVVEPGEKTRHIVSRVRRDL